jgi:hypothetical protein
VPVLALVPARSIEPSPSHLRFPKTCSAAGCGLFRWGAKSTNYQTAAMPASVAVRRKPWDMCKYKSQRIFSVSKGSGGSVKPRSRKYFRSIVDILKILKMKIGSDPPMVKCKKNHRRAAVLQAGIGVRPAQLGAAPPWPNTAEPLCCRPEG